MRSCSIFELALQPLKIPRANCGILIMALHFERGRGRPFLE